MLEKLADFPDNVIAYTFHGEITGEDYESVLIPDVEDRLKTHPKICCFYHLAPDFTDFTSEALWDDTKIGFKHLTAWEKVAFVSDNQMLRQVTKIVGFLLPCPVKVFTNDQFADAKTWITT